MFIYSSVGRSTAAGAWGEWAVCQPLQPIQSWCRRHAARRRPLPCLPAACVCVCGGISNSCATATASCDELMLSSATSVARTQLTESSRLWLWLVNETSTAAVTAQCTEWTVPGSIHSESDAVDLHRPKLHKLPSHTPHTVIPTIESIRNSVANFWNLSWWQHSGIAYKLTWRCSSASIVTDISAKTETSLQLRLSCKSADNRSVV